MGLFQLVHSQVHRASPTVCHHVAVSCSVGTHSRLALHPQPCAFFRVTQPLALPQVSSSACGDAGMGYERLRV